MISDEQSSWNNSTEEWCSEACVLFIDCICLGASCMLLVDTVEKQFMRDEVLKENICQPQTCTEIAGWRGELHTQTSMYWERIAAYKHHNNTEITRRRGAVKLNGHLSCMCATHWEDWVQFLLGSNFSGSASGVSDHAKSLDCEMPWAIK